MIRLRPVCALLLALLPAGVTLCPGTAAAAPPAGSEFRDGTLVLPPSLEFTFPCDRLDGCRNPGASQQPDRQVRPFDGTLGRPCAYRFRATPSGTRKVRICH